MAAPCTALSRGAFCYLISCPPAIPTLWWAYSFGSFAESPNPSAFPTWWGEVFLPGLVLSNGTVDSESVVGIKPGDSGVVIGYQVDEFTHTWSAE